MKRREFIKGAAALAAYSQLEKAEALTNNQLLTVLGTAQAPAGFAFKLDGTGTPVVDGTGSPILIRIS